MNEKIYIGNGAEFGQYRSIGGSICLDDIPNEFITTGKNGKRYFNYTINRKRETDQFGKTHSVEIDQWKPQPKQEGYSQQPNNQPQKQYYSKDGGDNLDKTNEPRYSSNDQPNEIPF